MAYTRRLSRIWRWHAGIFGLDDRHSAMVPWRPTCKTKTNGFRAKLLLWRARQLARFRGTWRAFNTREIRKQLTLLLLQPVIVRLRIRE